MHDYKNAIKVCGKLLDPKEWFFMNSFEFIEVRTKKAGKSKKS